MLVASNAIVLHCLPYSDSTHIVHLYTEDFGRMSYMVRLSKGKQSGLKRALFQPLSILSIQADHKGSRQLQRLKDATTTYPFSSVPFDVIKSSIALFLAEVLYRSLRDTERNPDLFEFMSRSIQWLDLGDKGLANFHLVFLIKLTRYLGFYPNLENRREGWFFDLQGGVFVPNCPPHTAWLGPADALAFSRLMRINYDNMDTFGFEHGQRVRILRLMLDYYRLHLIEFPQIKSLDVLVDLFR